MNWLDTVVFLFLVMAACKGWRQGVIVQVLGLAALVLGIFLAWKFGGAMGALFGLDGTQGGVARAVGFVAVLVVVVIGVALIGRFARGLFRIVGLGVFDNILGAVFSALKIFVLVGLVVILVTSVDGGKIISERTREGSIFYEAFGACLRGWL